MGTRGAVGVKLGDQIFATYNHFDSYPSSLGTRMVEFCRGLSKDQLAVLKERFKHVVIVDDYDDKPTEENQKRYVEAGFYDETVGDRTPGDWYNLLRKIQGMGYIQAVLDGTCQHWIDGKNFLENGLSCEYAYIIDLDKETIEFYEGGSEEPDKNSPLPFEQAPDEHGYYPVKFMGRAALEAIPDDWIKKFYPDED
jgi:hypothetical protein